MSAYGYVWTAPAWREAGVPPESPRGYPVPRRHTHFWFLATGSHATAMFAKICGVDLRPGKFEVGRIAQTSIARMNTVAVRDDQGDVPAYHLLGDSASGAYLWNCLIDAMSEFDGAPVGLAALQAIVGKNNGGASFGLDPGAQMRCCTVGLGIYRAGEGE